MILRGLKIDCSLFFSERTEDRGSWVGSSTHGYILIPSSLKTTLLWESLTQPCNECILKKSRKIFVHLFFFKTGMEKSNVCLPETYLQMSEEKNRSTRDFSTKGGKDAASVRNQANDKFFFFLM